MALEWQNRSVVALGWQHRERELQRGLQNFGVLGIWLWTWLWWWFHCIYMSTPSHILLICAVGYISKKKKLLILKRGVVPLVEALRIKTKKVNLPRISKRGIRLFILNYFSHPNLASHFLLATLRVYEQ